MNRRMLIGLVLVTQIVTLVAAAALLGVIPGVSAQLAMADAVRHYSLLAETMQPLDSTIGYDNASAFLKTTQDSKIYTSTAYIGQLDLPDGARIVRVVCFGLDTDPNQEFTFRVYRYSLRSDPVWSAVTDYAYSGVSFDGGRVTAEATVDPDRAVIDNAEFSYGLYLLLPTAQTGDLGVLRCLVDTAHAVSLPRVQRNSTDQ
jgi:hypothetical protein